MREIKFRAWDKKKMWHVSGFNVLADNGWVAKLALSEEPFVKELSDTDGVLMQFTGLKDKNGKEIYEGDIVQYFNYAGKKIYLLGRKIVKWNLGTVQNGFNIAGARKKMVEVIGNIYENPELLK